MTRTVRTRAPKAKTLAQQKTDFTAEGAPPPGPVVAPTPHSVEPANLPPSRAPAVEPSAIEQPRPGKSR